MTELTGVMTFMIPPVICYEILKRIPKKPEMTTKTVTPILQKALTNVKLNLFMSLLVLKAHPIPCISTIIIIDIILSNSILDILSFVPIKLFFGKVTFFLYKGDVSKRFSLTLYTK